MIQPPGVAEYGMTAAIASTRFEALVDESIDIPSKNVQNS